MVETKTNNKFTRENNFCHKLILLINCFEVIPHVLFPLAPNLFLFFWWSLMYKGWQYVFQKVYLQTKNEHSFKVRLIVNEIVKSWWQGEERQDGSYFTVISWQKIYHQSFGVFQNFLTFNGRKWLWSLCPIHGKAKTQWVIEWCEVPIWDLMKGSKINTQFNGIMWGSCVEIIDKLEGQGERGGGKDCLRVFLRDTFLRILSSFQSPAIYFW